MGINKKYRIIAAFEGGPQSAAALALASNIRMYEVLTHGAVFGAWRPSGETKACVVNLIYS